MNKKVLLFSLLLFSGGVSSSFAQEESSRTLIVDEVEYGTPDQTYNTYKTTWKKNRFKDNWTISVGAGVQTIFGEDDSKADFKDRLTFAPQFTITKNFAPTWGLKLNFTGGTLHGFNDGNSGTYRKWNNGKKNYNGQGVMGTPGYPGWTNSKGQTISLAPDFGTWDPRWNYMYTPEEIYDRVREDGTGGWSWYPPNAAQPDSKGGWRDADGNMLLYMQHIRYIQMNIDFEFNLFTLLGDYNPKRFYELSPYGGIGVYNAFSNLGTENFLTFGVHGGLLSKFRVSDRLHVNFDLSASLTPDEFDGQRGGERSFTGLAQATLGLGYTFGKTYWEPVEPMDYDLINRLNDEINDLRNRPVPVCPECPPAPVIVEEVVKPKEEVAFLPDPVFFRINQSVIDPAEWPRIEKAVDYLIKNPDANVIVTGYADKDTATPQYNMKLSERRAKTVAQALTQRFGINPLRVSINWSGSEIQPFKINEWNRVVIFVIEN